MKVYKTQKEVEKDIKKGVLVIDDDVTFECDISIEASIDAYDIFANNIDSYDINALDIFAHDINALDINAHDINAHDIKYSALCLSYNSITCTSIKGYRKPHQEPICLDGTLTKKGLSDDKTEEAMNLLKSKGFKIIKEAK